MTEVTKYMCDVCGITFDDKESCYAHETSHKIGNLFEIEGVKFYAGGQEVDASRFKSLNAFLGKVEAIEVPNSDAAEVINDFYRKNEFNEPFEDVDSKRVYFDDHFCEWLDANDAIKRIKSSFGEK